MSLEQRLTSLIRAGRHVIDSDFDPMAFHEWRKEANECMSVLLGPEDRDKTSFEYRGTQSERGKPQA
jgi:hypothetical protein